MFHPGETVTFTFTIPFASNAVNNVIVTFKQNDCLIVKKIITSVTAAQTAGFSTVMVVLTQQESLLFKENKDFKIQLNVFKKDGSRATSKEMSSTNGVQHYKEVMTSV